MKQILFLFLLIWGGTTLNAQGILFEIPDWESVLDKSEKENKPIFLYANVYDCVPCADLEKYAFQDSTIGSFFNNNFINVSMDMESFPGIEIAEKYQIFVYPGMLFFNAKGEVLHRTCGAMEGKQLLYEARVALDDKENLKAYQERFYRGEQGYNFLNRYGALLDNACLDSRTFINYYFKNVEKSNWTDSTSWMMIRNFVYDPYSEPFTFLQENYSAYVSKYGKQEVDQKIYDVFMSQFVSIYEGQDLTLFATQSLNTLISKFSFEGKNELEQLTQLLYAEQVEDWELYAEKVIELYQADQIQDGFQLNEFGWKFYLFVEKKEYLNEALSWMKKVVKEKTTPTNLDTYASLLFKSGDKKQAVKKSEEALLLAQKLGDDITHYQVQLSKFKTQ